MTCEVTPCQPIRIPEISNEQPFPTFSKPEILGCFSLDAQRQYIDGPAFLKFLRLSDGDLRKEVKFDLDKNCAATNLLEEEQNQRETSELVQLLKWVHLHKDFFQSRRPDFLLYRGLMSKILNTPYDNRDGWTIGGIWKEGTIYLRNIDNAQTLAQRQNYNADPRLRRMSDWGYHFEHFLLSDDPTKPPDPSRQVKEECNVVYTSKLNQHRIMYAAELDGVWWKDGKDINPKKHPELLPQCHLVELKTTRFFPNGQMTYNFKRYNLRKWWCQSFPALISDVIIGYRDDEGVVHQLEQMPLREMPKLGADWTGTVCFNFLDQFLTEVKQVFHKSQMNAEDCVFIFEFTPQTRRKDNCIEVTVVAEKNSSKMLHNLV